MGIITTDGPTPVISVTGQLKSASFPQLVREMHRLQDQGHVDLIVDLEGTSDVSSAGLIVLQVVAEQAAASGGTIALSGAQPHVARVMQAMGLSPWFIRSPRANELSGGGNRAVVSIGKVK